MLVRLAAVALAATSSVPGSAQTAAAGANAERGRVLFMQCVACHSTARGAAHKVGPNLSGIFGAQAATRPGYNYSPALRRANFRWDDARMANFIQRPNAVVPGTKMVFPGISDPAKRRDLVAYMKTLR